MARHDVVRPYAGYLLFFEGEVVEVSPRQPHVPAEQEQVELLLRQLAWRLARAVRKSREDMRLTHGIRQSCTLIGTCQYARLLFLSCNIHLCDDVAQQDAYILSGHHG